MIVGPELAPLDAGPELLPELGAMFGPGSAGVMTPRSVLALQLAAGNRAVTGALGSGWARPRAVQRDPSTEDGEGVPAAKAPTNAELIADAEKTHDIPTIKKITNFAAASEPQRIQFIGDLMNQTWVGPLDERALEQIWDSFGPDGVLRIAGEHGDLWKNSIDRGASLLDIPAIRQVRDDLQRDVKELAKGYMKKNLDFANAEFQRLGIEQGDGPKSPTAALEADLALQGVQADTQAAKVLLDQQAKLREVNIGWARGTAESSNTDTTDYKFEPEGKQPQVEVLVDPRHPGRPPAKSWEETKAQWDDVTAALAAITARNPTVFAAVASGGESVTALATQTPAQAKDTARKVLTTLRDNINRTTPKIDSGDLDWRDLTPIHDQLKAGTKGVSGRDWHGTFGKSVIDETIGDHKSHEFWVNLGLGTAAAALFIVAEIATGGLATAALLGGLVISGGTAIAAWDNYDTLATAAGSAGSDKTKVVSQGQVDDARIGAIIAAAALFLDMAAPLLKEFQAAAKGAAILEAATERSAATALTKAAAAGPAAFEGAVGKELIERSVVELGVDETVQKSGKTVQQLIEIVGKDLKLGRARAPRGRGGAWHGGGDDGGWRQGRDRRRHQGRDAGRAGLPGERRALPELVQELPGAVRAGTLTWPTAEKLIAEAIDRIGPGEVAKRGGWRDLSQALGAESAAGRRSMEWRNAIFDDLEQYVKNELKGEVQRTGTVKNFTNDIDMSFTGATATATKDAASKYLAARLGTDNFERMMMAGLFTDPRRMHLYDVLPAALREKVAAVTASHQEGLIWNRRLYDATHAGNTQLAETIRSQMRELGVAEFAYRPLESGDITRLAERIDSLHADLDKAVQAGDTAAQAQLVEQIGDAQALINASEGGGYFSGGGVRRYVSERPGEAGFARPDISAGAPALAPERLTAILDQAPKLEHAAEEIGKGTPDQIQAGIRGIGKYGTRLSEVTGEAGIKDASWEAIAVESKRLKDLADQAGTAAEIGRDSEARSS